VPPDPLRNRIEHFPLLTRGEQTAFLASAQLRCQEHLEHLREHEARKKEGGELLAQLVFRGSVRMMQVRLDWLREVAKALDLSDPGCEKKRA
jgi:hypothetical protein